MTASNAAGMTLVADDTLAPYQWVMAQVPGLTVRQIDYWTREGFIACYRDDGARAEILVQWSMRRQPGTGSGRARYWRTDEIKTLRRVVELSSIGVRAGAAFAIARGESLGADVHFEFTGRLA